MAVIGVTITESSLQLLAGIPKTVSIDSSSPASIFYTLDGSEPDVNSTIYVGPLNLPTSSGIVILKVFVTDGVDSSPVITKTYMSSSIDAKRGHNQISGLNAYSESRANSFPFGNPYQPVPATIGPTVGIIVDSPSISNISDGYNGTGTGTSSSGTDLPLSSYDLIFSTSNSLGERGHGIGTLPSNIILPAPTPPNTSSNVNDRFFNPKSLVIYQDSRDEPFDTNVSQLNRQFFSLEDPEKIKSGALLFNTAFDGMQPTGSFVRAHYNPRENITTYYYFDSATLRWIISKEQCQPKKSVSGGLFNIAFSSRQQGVGLVFKWMPFVGRKLI